MANQVLELMNGYKQWEAIVQDQLVILGQERTDELFNEIKELELKKNNIKLMVMELSETVDMLDSESAKEVSYSIERMQKLNLSLQNGIEHWYSHASSNMKQVSNQRRIINSYGGVQNSDVVSLYFDSKN